jgi:hypothetical protein
MTKKAGLPSSGKILSSLEHLIVCFLGASASLDCTTQSGCYLNGDCVAGVCRCNTGWTGPHCGQFNFMPTPPGPLGGKAYPPEADSSSWGSSVIKGSDGRYHMYASGILGKCGLAAWAPNAALTHAVSNTLDGVYEAHDVIMRGSNPQITHFEGELRLWHILAGGTVGPSVPGYCSTCTNGSTPYTCRKEASLVRSAPHSAKLIVATDPAGPWRDRPVTCQGYGKDGKCPSTQNPTGALRFI